MASTLLPGLLDRGVGKLPSKNIPFVLPGNLECSGLATQAMKHGREAFEELVRR